MTTRKLTNKYAAKCTRCGETVFEGRGVLTPPANGGKWLVEHDGRCPGDNAEFTPTAEQQACLDLYLSGESLVIEAGAGTGKTSTLLLLANATPGKRIHYLAFNKSIVVDVRDSMPDNVTASTAHALAHSSIVKGTPFAKRLANSVRVKSIEIARRLEVRPYFVEGCDRVLAADYLGSLVLRTIEEFCKTADLKPSYKHVPYIDGIDDPGPRGARTYTNNKAVARYLEPFIKRAWRDLSNPNGQLPFRHGHYLKLWQLSHPVIETDVILFDEAQDANPVMAAVIAEQTHAQRVYVGDSNQAIYEFTGAVNAIAEMKASGVLVRQLTQSFRFGVAVADAANEILAELESDLKLQGFDQIQSTVGAIDGEPDAILTRTNACAVDCILSAQERGVKAHLVGGGDEVLRFARAAKDLQVAGSTSHPELACFTSWDEVKSYVENDESGADLKLNVELIEKYGYDVIVQALGNMPTEGDAELVITTAHKSKGREWDKVVIATDFVKESKKGENPQPPSAAELRLRYVAVTRAKKQLDNTVFTSVEEEEQA